MGEIGAVAADGRGDGLARFGMDAHFPGQGKEGERPFEIHLIHGHVARDRRALGLVPLAELHIGAEASTAERHLKPRLGIKAEHLGAFRRRVLLVEIGHLPGIAAFGIVGAADEGAELAELEAQLALAAGGTGARVAAVGGLREDVGAEKLIEIVEHLADTQFPGGVHRRREIPPEGAQHVLPADMAGRDLVQLLLEIGGEIIFHITPEEAFEEGGDQPPLVLGHEAVAVHAHIFAIAQHLQDRGIGGRPADAELFHLLHERRFGVARRRLGEMLLGEDLGHVRRHAAGKLGQAAAVLVVALVVPAFLIQGEKAVEDLHRTRCAEEDFPIRGCQRRRGAVEFRRFHLARHGALPDELVEPVLVVVQIALHLFRAAPEIGGADRLVGFLGVLGLGLVDPRLFGQVAAPGRSVVEGFGDQLAAGGDRLFRHLHAVRSHVGDETHGLAADIHALIEPLRHLHGAGGAEAELSRRFLLQGGGGEGRLREAPLRLGFNFRYREARGFDARFRRIRRALVPDAEAVELRAVQLHEAGCECFLLRRQHVGRDGPVFLGAEGLDLPLALADEAERHGLHAACGAGARKLAPQDGRQGEAHEIVKGAAGEVGVHQLAVDVAGVGDALLQGGLGDLVEDHALDADVLQNALRLQHLQHMPGDGLALAVGVGGEIEIVRVLDRAGNLVEALGAVPVHFPIHGEVLLGTHGSVPGRQVPNMAVTCEDFIIAAEILVDCLGLGGRFNDDDVAHSGSNLRNGPKAACSTEVGVTKPYSIGVASASARVALPCDRPMHDGKARFSRGGRSAHGGLQGRRPRPLRAAWAWRSSSPGRNGSRGRRGAPPARRSRSPPPPP